VKTTLLALALALPAPPASGQFAPARDERARVERAHAAAVQAERVEGFRRAWDAASEPSREEAAALLAPGPAEPSLERLARAQRMLEGSAGADGTGLAAFADALDLRVVPGAFATRGSAGAQPERGEPLVVRVRALYAVPLGPGVDDAASLELSLFWIAPDGTEERARTETFDPLLFLASGVPLYIRGPLVERPGPWRLVAECVWAGERARGVAVPVPCLDAGCLEAARRGEGTEALSLLLERGVRPLESAPGELLALCGRRPEVPGRLDPGPPQEAAAVPSGAPLQVVLLASGRELAPPLHGTPGRAWRSLARRLGLELSVLDAGELERAELAGELERLAERGPCVLVAAGRAVPIAASLLAGDDRPPLAGLVCVRDELTPGGALQGLPTLLLTADGPEREPRPASPGMGVPQTIRGGPNAFLAAPRVPDLVEPWLRGFRTETPTNQR